MFPWEQIDYQPVEQGGHPFVQADHDRASGADQEGRAHAIAEAERPVLYVGGGVIYSRRERGIARPHRTDAYSRHEYLLGKGAIPETHVHSLGMLGMHGTAYANYAVAHCDLLIAVGARFDDRVTGKLDAFATKAKVIHIDIDPAEIGKTVHVDIPIVGDCKNVLQDIVEAREASRGDRVERADHALEERYPLHYPTDGKLYPQYVIEKIWEMTNGDAVVATGVGQHQMWAAQFFKAQYPRQFLSSGGLGTMGYGCRPAWARLWVDPTSRYS